jgi:hypothetical protein
MPAAATFVKLGLDLDTCPTIGLAQDISEWAGAFWPTVLRIAKERGRCGTIEPEALTGANLCRRGLFPSTARPAAAEAIEAYKAAGLLLADGDNWRVWNWAATQVDPRDIQGRTRKKPEPSSTRSNPCEPVGSYVNPCEPSSTRSNPRRDVDVDVDKETERDAASQAAAAAANGPTGKKKRAKADRSALHTEVIEAYNAAVSQLKSRFRPVLCQSPSDKTLKAIDFMAEKLGDDFLPRWHRICRWLNTDDKLSGRRRNPEGEEFWDWQADLPFLLRPAQWEKIDPKARQWDEEETARAAAAEMEKAAAERRAKRDEEERAVRNAESTAKINARLEAVGLSREAWTGNPMGLYNEMTRREDAKRAQS